MAWEWDVLAIEMRQLPIRWIDYFHCFKKEGVALALEGGVFRKTQNIMKRRAIIGRTEGGRKGYGFWDDS